MSITREIAYSLDVAKRQGKINDQSRLSKLLEEVVILQRSGILVSPYQDAYLDKLSADETQTEPRKRLPVSKEERIKIRQALTSHEASFYIYLLENFRELCTYHDVYDRFYPEVESEEARYNAIGQMLTRIRKKLKAIAQQKNLSGDKFLLTVDKKGFILQRDVINEPANV